MKDNGEMENPTVEEKFTILKVFMFKVFSLKENLRIKIAL
jgi:hypothetical protein